MLQGMAQGYQGQEQLNLAQAIRQAQMAQQQSNSDRSFGLQQDRFGLQQDQAAAADKYRQGNLMLKMHEMAANNPMMQSQEPETLTKDMVAAMLSNGTLTPESQGYDALSRIYGFAEKTPTAPQSPFSIPEPPVKWDQFLRQSLFREGGMANPQTSTGDLRNLYDAYQRGSAIGTGFMPSPHRPLNRGDSFGQQAPQQEDPHLAAFRSLTPQQLATFDWEAYERDNPGKSESMKAMLSQ